MGNPILQKSKYKKYKNGSKVSKPKAPTIARDNTRVAPAWNPMDRIANFPEWDFASGRAANPATGQATYVPIESLAMPAARGLGKIGNFVADAVTGSARSVKPKQPIKYTNVPEDLFSPIQNSIYESGYGIRSHPLYYNLTPDKSSLASGSLSNESQMAKLLYNAKNIKNREKATLKKGEVNLTSQLPVSSYARVMRGKGAKDLVVKKDQVRYPHFRQMESRTSPLDIINRQVLIDNVSPYKNGGNVYRRGAKVHRLKRRNDYPLNQVTANAASVHYDKIKDDIHYKEISDQYNLGYSRDLTKDTNPVLYAGVDAGHVNRRLLDNITTEVLPPNPNYPSDPIIRHHVNYKHEKEKYAAPHIGAYGALPLNDEGTIDLIGSGELGLKISDRHKPSPYINAGGALRLGGDYGGIMPIQASVTHGLKNKNAPNVNWSTGIYMGNRLRGNANLHWPNSEDRGVGFSGGLSYSFKQGGRVPKYGFGSKVLGALEDYGKMQFDTLGNFVGYDAFQADDYNNKGMATASELSGNLAKATAPIAASFIPGAGPLASAGVKALQSGVGQLQTQQLAGNAIMNQPGTIAKHGGYMKFEHGTTVPIEAEGGEGYDDPNGNYLGEIKGPSHEQGGVDMMAHAPIIDPITGKEKAAFIYPKGKFQEMNLALERFKSKTHKLLSKRPNDKYMQAAHDGNMANLSVQEEDLKDAVVANKIAKEGYSPDTIAKYGGYMLRRKYSGGGFTYPEFGDSNSIEVDPYTPSGWMTNQLGTTGLNLSNLNSATNKPMSLSNPTGRTAVEDPTLSNITKDSTGQQVFNTDKYTRAYMSPYGQAGMALIQNAGNIARLAQKRAPLTTFEKVNLKRMDPYESNRAIQEKTNALMKAIPGMSGGNAATAFRMSQGTTQQGKSDIAQNTMAYDNANAQIDNQENLYNNQLSKEQVIAREMNEQAFIDSKLDAADQIGQNLAGQAGDNLKFRAEAQKIITMGEAYPELKNSPVYKQWFNYLYGNNRQNNGDQSFS